MDYTYGPSFCKKNYVDRFFSFFSRVFGKWGHGLKNQPNYFGLHNPYPLGPFGKSEDRAVLWARARVQVQASAVAAALVPASVRAQTSAPAALLVAARRRKRACATGRGGLAASSQSSALCCFKS